MLRKCFEEDWKYVSQRVNRTIKDEADLEKVK